MPELFDSATQWDADLHGTLLIEASAGTGKTYTIGNLYLRHVLEGRLPADILVVSFTNAATDELKLRIRRRLSEALQVFDQPDVKDDFLSLLASRIEAMNPDEQMLQRLRLQLALRNMDEAVIFTIHGFCQVALNEFALLGNHHFEQQIITNDNELWEQALKDWWRDLCYPMPETHWQLLLMGQINLASISTDVTEFRRHRSKRYLPEVIPAVTEILLSWESCGESLKKLSVDWPEQREAIFQALQNSTAISQAKSSKVSQKALPGLFTLLDNYFYESHPLLIPGELWHLSQSSIEADTKPSKRGQDEALEQPFFHAVQAIRERVSDLQQVLRRRLQIDAMSYCMQRVHEYKLHNNLVSFDDQIDRLLEALRSPTGSELASRLASRFPVAMIDEFQDTDDAQYALFEQIYRQKAASSLGLIGDPKQSIYGFRGADIFTYIDVSQQSHIRHYSLQTNWRSDPDLVNAVNGIFSNRADAFVFGDSIPFAPAQAAERPRVDQLLIKGEEVSALSLWQLPVDEKAKAYSNQRLFKSINTHICEEIRKLLANGQINGKPVCSGDIAILVRSAWQGEALREVMLEHGLNAISIGRDSIFASEQASDLLQLLEAIVNPVDDGMARRARSSGLFSLGCDELVAELLDNQRWQDWSATLLALHERWRSYGFVAMFSDLLHNYGLLEAVAAQRQAERKLTNLVHLGELLIKQSKNTPGMEALLAWLSKQIETPVNDEAELRLESDDALIKIITIHKSKGLEYPIVFVPYSWDGRLTERDRSFLKFHDQNGQTVIDLNSEKIAEHWLLADKERLAEDLRLLYVALTRARSKLYLTFGHAGLPGKKTRASASALSWLLTAGQSARQLDSEHILGYADPQELTQKLLDFSAKQPALELVPLAIESPAIDHHKSQPSSRSELVSRTFKRQFSIAWKVNSFSGLTRDIHQATHVDDSVVTEDPILNFEAGSHVGLLIHALLESIDFTGDIETQAVPLIETIAADYGIRAKEQGELLTLWLKQIVDTSLDESDLRLSKLSVNQRLNELDFDYPVGLFETAKINHLLQQYSRITLSPLGAADFTGMMTGSIDLVFEHQGKFYLADYKSNLLGKSLDDYSPQILQLAMAERRYDLQLLIYTLALHRYLQQRVVNYSYEQHFGGCFYLFLRGMRETNNQRYGIFFDKPSFDLIRQLDDILSVEASR